MNGAAITPLQHLEHADMDAERAAHAGTDEDAGAEPSASDRTANYRNDPAPAGRSLAHLDRLREIDRQVAQMLTRSPSAPALSLEVEGKAKKWSAPLVSPPLWVVGGGAAAG